MRFDDESRTAYVVATGPSAVGAGLDLIQPASTIAVSDAWTLIPDAAACYAADWDWWQYHAARVQRGFSGRCLSGSDKHLPAFVRSVPGRDGSGLCQERGMIHWGAMAGRNSALQAMGIAYRSGARRLVLIGVDLGEPKPSNPSSVPPHFFGDHPPALSRKRSDYPAFKVEIEKLVADLHREGVITINVSPYSVIKGCRHLSLEAACGMS